MMRKTYLFFLVLILVILMQKSTSAQSSITNLKVVCDRWPDGSSMLQFSEDSIRLMDAQTEEEKALAIWRFIRMWSTRTDGNIPREPALGDNSIDDPVKVLNIYGAHWCDGLARAMEVAWRSLGFRAEKLYRTGHTQADVYWQDSDGQKRWHMLDVSEGWYVYDRSAIHIASADEISRDYSLIFRPSTGPIPKAPLYSGIYNWIHAPHLDWPTHSMNLSLRLGEKIIYYWKNVSMPYQDNFAAKGAIDFEHGPYPVTYGNSIVEYSPDLTKSSYEQGLYAPAQNTCSIEEDGKSPNLHPRTAGQNSSMIYKMEYPYIISNASFSGNFYRKTPSDAISVSISTDGGNIWKNVWQSSQTGNFSVQDINIAEKFNIYGTYPANFISPFGRYEYLLKIEMQSAAANNDVGINNFSIKTTLQNNIFSLPQLWPGINNITISGNKSEATALKVSYVWDDNLGVSRKNIAVAESFPYTYPITTSGSRWEDVKVVSLTVEAASKTGQGNRIEVAEQKPATVITVTPQDAFPTSKIVGTSQPGALKTAQQYITDLGTPSLQIEALSGLSVIKDPSSYEAVKAVAYDSISHPNKELAMQTMYSIKGSGSIPDLMEFIKKNASIKFKYDAANKFVELGHWYSISALAGKIMAEANETSAAPHLAAVLDNVISNGDTWWEPHASIIRSLGELGDALVATSIRPFLLRNADEAAIATWALGELRDTGSLTQIRNLFYNNNYQMFKTFGAGALSKLGDQEIAPTLYTMLQNSDENYRYEAADALGRLGNKSAVPYLQNLLNSETFPWVRDAAQNSINVLNAQYHASDLNGDGCVDNPELFAFMDRWYMNNLDVTLKEIIEAIGLWKKGC